MATVHANQLLLQVKIIIMSVHFYWGKICTKTTRITLHLNKTKPCTDVASSPTLWNSVCFQSFTFNIFFVGNTVFMQIQDFPIAFSDYHMIIQIIWLFISATSIQVTKVKNKVLPASEWNIVSFQSKENPKHEILWPFKCLWL